MHRGVKHNWRSFSRDSKFSVDAVFIDGDNALFCKTQLVEIEGLRCFSSEYLGEPKHICTSVPCKTALAGKVCYSLTGTME